MTPGQLGDIRAANTLLAPLPPPRICADDTAYDANGLRQFMIERGTIPVIPNNPTRKRLHPFDHNAYKRRNLIERMFCRLKDWRRIATRYDKLARNFLSAVSLAAAIIWWTGLSPDLRGWRTGEDEIAGWLPTVLGASMRVLTCDTDRESPPRE